MYKSTKCCSSFIYYLSSLSLQLDQVSFIVIVRYNIRIRNHYTSETIQKETKNGKLGNSLQEGSNAHDIICTGLMVDGKDACQGDNGEKKKGKMGNSLKKGSDAPKTPECTYGEKRKIGCATCSCSKEGKWLCTGLCSKGMQTTIQKIVNDTGINLSIVYVTRTRFYHIM